MIPAWSGQVHNYWLFIPIFFLMFGKLNSVVLCLFLLGIVFHVPAQQYGYVQYNTNSGAPFDQVSNVLKDEVGFVWIGTKNGLYRFDGTHFDMYSQHTQSQNIHQLHKQRDTLLFINDMGIYHISDLVAEPHVAKLLEGTINETDELPFYPNGFTVGNDQSIWLSQSNHSIGRLYQGQFTTYRFSKTEKAQQFALSQDTNGGIWALSPLEGLFSFNEATNSFEKKLALEGGTALLIHENHLWLGSDAITIYNINNSKLERIRTIELDNDQVSAMRLNKNDEYIVGTKKGKLFKVSDVQSPPQTIYGANEAHRVEELDFGHIHDIYVDTNTQSTADELWICSETGLWLLQQRFFKTVKNLPMNNPIAVSMGHEGKAYTPINYLYEIAPQGEEFTAKPIYDNLQVNAFAEDAAGFQWITTTTPKVELLQYANDNLIRRYDFHDRGETIFNLYPDSKQNLWFCQAPVNKPIIGLAQINAQGKIKYYDETKGFSSRILTIKESSRGEIYAAGIGESSYLYRYDPERDQFENLSPELPFTALLNFEVHDLTIDDRGVVWLATTDGLLRYDGEKITLIQNDILGQEEIRGVAHYPNNSIWIATATKGLVFHQGNTSTALGETEGLPAVISAYRCINTDPNGHLWAGTAEGLVYSRMPAGSLPYSNIPRLRKVLINDQEIPAELKEGLQVKQREALHLEVTNLSFPAKNVEYEYRLLPKEDQEVLLEEQLWQSNATGNALLFNNMEPGTYQLEVRARQSGGYQWSPPLQLDVKVFLPWYAQSWLRYALLAALLGFVSYFFRFYVKRRFLRLQSVLNYSNEKLAKKEEQLHQKIQEFEEQRTELDNANLNIRTLELFIKEIPKKASWDDVITAMGKAVNESSEINAFEIAFKEKNEIVHRGYSSMERSGYTFRSKPFNTKSSLTCWAMAHEKEVLINDFKKEHTQYIDEKEAYHFDSLIFIPFALENAQPVVLCAYSTEKNQFDHNDIVMFRILSQFIHFSIHHKISKKV
ncbi:MAG: hypothetical protein AAF039_18100 [Bacteroidota bacterium]